jgi:predicted outer membrane protein
MSRQLWVRGIWGFAAAMVCSAATIAAQQTQPPQQNQGAQPNPVAQQNQFGQPLQNNPQQAQRRNWNAGQGNPGMAGVGRTDVDHYLIKVLIKANKDEIEMGKLAEQRSQNASVKQLATQMVQDHTRFLGQLESFKKTEHAGANPQAGMHQQTQPGMQQQTQRGTAFRGTVPGTEPANGANQQQQPQQFPNPQVAQQQPGANNTQPGFAGNRMHHGDRMANMGEHGAAGQFATIMEEVDRNMQQALLRDLSSQQGAQFDRCYLSSQLFGHMWVAEALKTFERDASPQLKSILQEGLQATEQHLTHIKSLLAKEENQPAAAPSARFQPRTPQITR